MTQLLQEVPLSEILFDEKFNCRDTITVASVADLVNDIKNHGLQNPISIQPYEKDGKKYRLISGHRRYKAFEVLKMKTIPCLIRENISDIDAVVLNLNENAVRKDLNIVEEAHAIAHLKELGLTRKEVCEKLNRPASWVSQRFYLLDYPEDIQQEFAAKTISTDYILKLRPLKDEPDELYKAVRTIKDKKAKGEKAHNIGRAQPKPATLKKVRQPRDIEAMLLFLMDCFHNKGNIVTRLLAWAAGNISDYEIYEDLVEFAKANDLEFEFQMPLAHEDTPYLKYVGKT